MKTKQFKQDILTLQESIGFPNLLRSFAEMKKAQNKKKNKTKNKTLISAPQTKRKLKIY